LVIEGSDRAVLVDRGWIPVSSERPASWARYRPPAPGDPLEVEGWLRPAPGGGGRPASGMPARLVADLDPGHVQPLVGHPLLPLGVVQVPDPVAGAPAARPRDVFGDRVAAAPEDDGALPYRQRPNPDLGDGVHVIAAVQWFSFGVIGAFGYLVFLGRYSTPRGGRAR